MESVLVTGACGTVGSYINYGIRTGRAELDITDAAAVQAAFVRHKPKTVIHLAALVDVVLCENDPSLAYRINTVGTYLVARAARAHDARMIYVSTSGIFDGNKKDPYELQDAPNPLNVYGHSKYLGELAVQGLLEDFVIVRTSWIFGGGQDKDKKFVGKVLSQKDMPEIRAVADRRGSPTYAKDLANALKTLCKQDVRGILHIGGGVASRFEVAKEALALAGSATRVIPVPASEFPSSFSSGENESMPLSQYVRPWKEALAEYIRTEWN